MPEQLRPLKAGERLDGIPAAAWNEFVEAARFVRELKATLGVDRLRDVPQTGITRVKNGGYDRNQNDVAGIDGVFPTPTDNLNGFRRHAVLQGSTPTDSGHHGLFAILQRAARAGEIRPGALSGLSVAKVYVPSGREGCTFADVKDGDAGSLEASPSGSAKILWRETGLGTKWAVVRLSNVQVLIYGAAKGGGTVPAGSTVPLSSSIYSRGVTLSGDGLLLPYKGTYHFGFQATLEAPDAPRNAILRMQLFAGGSATSWIGHRENWVRSVCELNGAVCSCDNSPAIADRKQEISEGAYYYCEEEIWHTAENVAVSGVVEIPSDGTIIEVRNTGYVEYTAGAYQLWARRIPD